MTSWSRGDCGHGNVTSPCPARASLRSEGSESQRTMAVGGYHPRWHLETVSHFCCEQVFVSIVVLYHVHRAIAARDWLGLLLQLLFD